MLLSEVVEEIAEKSPHYLSDPSIVRKVNVLRNQLKRSHSTDNFTSSLDLESGLAQYPLPGPQGNIKEVVVNGCPYPRSELGAKSPSHYYYILSGTIGIYPTPTIDVKGGIKIFRTEAKDNLSIGGMNDEVGLDPEYDMLLVWGVLKDIDPNNESFKNRYNELFQGYWAASLSVDSSVVRGRW